MRRLGRLLLRLVGALLVLVLLLLAPVAWTEATCRGDIAPDDRQPIIADEGWQRPESRTLLTYPEWHIVHAYDDYAAVIADGDPHEFGFLRAIAGFWTALCPLQAEAMRMGPVTTDTKLTIYTIGVSFTAELLAKAAYEETAGRLFTWIRGPERALLDEVSAEQAAAYAGFLQQVPWYRWDFAADREELRRLASDEARDQERAFALGLEYAAKGAYAQVIARAAAGVGPDALRLRSVVDGLRQDELAAIEGIDVIGPVPQGGVLVETDRYRAYTRLLQRLAAEGADMVEIAGNDEILFTAISPRAAEDGALYSFARQGRDDYRHLFLVPVGDLLDRLRAMDGSDLTLEHVHDY
ncbi:hypothetical protein [Wenxinia marina]|uniref:Uncharacterized protein n=1 Tax=Wenxinia marina DSM 24838 TaxID=1123501 RepID=A0A0D0Q7B9_9RHOB|nr:hypothetical protein [Wenxinia marina]KIQ70329.1 hypothetical protein Wenmar_00704 [Wenxinia marina DSM 24838]GGL53986.1 hypothetical protein GCM10011392_05470 [Wenxinia marina]